MKYLPIMQELFESDTYIFLIIGIAVSIVIGLFVKEKNRLIPAMCASVVIYGLCELLCNLCAGYMLQFCSLFLGTVAIGGIVGFAVGFIIKLLKKSK